jgi:two-component system, chemotaxis family, response regulator WspR
MGETTPHLHVGPSVLLVDEQASIGERVRAMLAPERDIGFFHCLEPAQALKRARELQPTVILQDLVMPAVDGFTLLRFYKACGELENTPVIVLSSREDPRDKGRAFELGASDYIVKLPNRIELVARVRAHSRSYQAQRERDAALTELAHAMQKLERSNAELARLSRTDALTGIANRRVFDEALDRDYRRLAREKRPLSLVLLDVDYFKRFNDHYGHVSGDRCLHELAANLAPCARRPGDLAARYGGEEFAMLLPDTTREGALGVAESVRTRVESLALAHAARADDLSIVTVSVGVSTVVPEDSSAPTRLIMAADAALYEAKQQGRNRVVQRY